VTGTYSQRCTFDKALPIFFFGDAVFVRPGSIHDAAANGVVTPEFLCAMYLPDNVLLANLLAGEGILLVKLFD
jgi:hypothetical protein